MFCKQELKELSHICAYCGKALSEKDKTVDHVKPKCANGKTFVNNIVICCSKCNLQKSNIDINSFLSRDEQKLKNFYNYLNLIDIQRGNNNYSSAILKKIESSLYVKEYRSKRESRLMEVQDIEYCINGTDIKFCLNEMQSKILDYYLKNKSFNNYRELARILKISYSEIKAQIIQINCLTGIFQIKQVSKNGIMLNDLYSKYLKIEKL